MDTKEIEEIMLRNFAQGTVTSYTIAMSIYYLAKVIKDKNFVINQPIRVQNNDLYNI